MRHLPLFALPSLMLLLVSCEVEHMEMYEQPITTLFYVLTPDSGQTVVLSFIDNDGIGGKPALTNSGTLRAHTTYRGQVMIGSANPFSSARLSHIIDSTSVVALPETHQVFFEPENELKTIVTYADFDSNGYPIGMETILESGSISQGELVISIIHRPDKSGANVKEGDRTRAGGTIDAEARFAVTVAD